MLFLGAGGSVAGASVAHTVFARQTARSIGWETNGFQFELGYASLAMGLAAIYASTVDEPAAWVVASIASGLFLLLAGFNHVREIVREKNYVPGVCAGARSLPGTRVSVPAQKLGSRTGDTESPGRREGTR